MQYLILWIVALHAIGAITFFNMVDGLGSDGIKESIDNLPPYLRIAFLLLWPYIMLYWMITGKNT
jgi:uncharacterized RDD family membrane protein YckC